MREERVAIGEMRVRVDRDRGHLELALERAAVERLDVLQLVHVVEVAGVDLPLGERVEHERVVGVGAVRDSDGASGHQDISARLP